MSDTLNIHNVVKYETLPSHYKRVLPFSVTVHSANGDLSLRERNILEEAIVNAGHEIARKRNDGEEAFRWSK